VSLKVALEMLGFGPCYHMSELFMHPEHATILANGLQRPATLKTIFDSYQSTVDYPGSSLWRPLLDQYPEAKVILTRRDPAKWYESVCSTVGKPGHVRMLMQSPLAPVALQLPAFGDEPGNPEATMRYFEEYGDAVKAEVPAKQLLVFKVQDGWEPLCAFLGVPVPDQPFPRLNDRNSMQSEGDLENLTFEQVQGLIRSANLL